MKLMSLVFGLVLSLLCYKWADAQVPPTDDHNAVYRLQPNLESVQAVLVPPTEIKPGFVYSYFNEGMQQRVWGFAKEGGGFEYAFGEGTTVPTSLFDMRLTPEMQARVLDERAPGLLRELDSVGRSAAVRLNSEGIWALLPFPSSARVFDMATGLRWEWHGKNRHAVVHTGGDLWHVVDGRYYPVNIVGEVCHR